MKKYLFLLVPFMVLLISFKSSAYSEQDVTNLRSTFYQYYGVQLNQGIAEAVLNKWDDNNNNYLVLQKTSTFYGFVVGTENGSNTTQYKLYGVKGITNYPTTDTNLTNYTWTASPTNYNVDIGEGNYKLGPWSSWHTVPIDWENPYYSANIPAPVFEVYNTELSPVPVVDVPLSFDFQFIPSNAYVEIWADYSIPTKINVFPFPPNSAQYRVIDYNVASVNVLDKELLFQSEALNSNYVHVILRDGWDDVLENFPIENIEFTTQGASSGWLDNKIADYEDLRKTNTLYGSAIKIKMRYFTIVDQTQFVVGPWRIWDSKNPETFTNELPSTYQVYLPANGTSGTNTDVSPNADIPVGSGTPTGTYYDPNVNITVTQNVPNYPDYPTIVSYNKDNLLVDTMNWADNLQGFFGEFGSFLEVSFAFIPGWIWAIIGFGFSLSIVVMFLKIL